MARLAQQTVAIPHLRAAGEAILVLPFRQKVHAFHPLTQIRLLRRATALLAKANPQLRATGEATLVLPFV